MLKHYAFAAIATFALSGYAAGRDLTDDDWAALEEVVIAHEGYLHAKDAGAVIDNFPPAVLPFIAQMTGVEPDVARQQGIDAMMSSAGDVSFDAFDIDYEAASGPYELSDGTTYVLIPTKMIDVPGDGTKLKDEVTVAVLVDEQWYLIGFDANDEVQLLIGAYPSFAEPEFMANFTEVLGTPAPDAAAAPEATPLTEEQVAALEARVTTFDAAVRANDMAGIMGVLPPKMVEAIAAQFNVTVDEVIVGTQQALDEALKTVTFVSYGMDLSTATVAAQPDGSPYVLIPTETVIDLGEAAGGKIRAQSSTLGFLEGDTWYIVRIDDPSLVAVLKQVYPGFAEIEFPTGTMEAVTE